MYKDSGFTVPDPFKVVMDRQEFESSHYQRVYQYLQRHIGNINLDQFSYIGNVESNSADCLETILQWVISPSHLFSLSLSSAPSYFKMCEKLLGRNLSIKKACKDTLVSSSKLVLPGIYFLFSSHLLSSPFPPPLLAFSHVPLLYFLSSASPLALVVCMIPHGQRFAILSSSWTYSYSLVRHQCSVMKHLLEMSWLAWKDLWSISWFECPGYIVNDWVYVPS